MSNLFSEFFHERRPMMDIALDYSATRNSADSNQVNYSFTATLTCRYSSAGEFYYSSNAVGIDITADGVTRRMYIIGEGSSSSPVYGEWSKSNTVNFSATNESTDGYGNVSVYVWCHQGTYADPTGGGEGGLNCTATGGPYDYSWASAYVAVPAYNPHTTPSVSASPSKWSKYNTSRSARINYGVNGDGSNHTLEVWYSYNGTNYSIGTWNNITSDGYKDISFNPSVVPRDTEYTLGYKFYVAGATSYSASGSNTLGIYGLPTLSMSQSNAITSKGSTNTITVNTTELNKDTGSTVTVTVAISDGSSSSSNTPINAKSTGSAQSGTYGYVTINASSWYTITATMTHNQSGETSVVTRYGYTYTQPDVASVVIQSTPFSPQDTTNLKWNTNSRGWSGENDFKTYVTISGSNKDNYDDTTNKGPTNANPSTSSTTTRPNSNNSTSADVLVSLVSGTYDVQSIFDNNARSVAQLSSTVTIKRNNPSGSLNATKSATFVIQYQPTKKPSDSTVKNPSGVNVQGQTIAIQDVSTITVGWSYNHTAGASGVVNGYKVRVYDSDGTTKQTKYYSKTALATPVSITLNTETELKRGKMNYAEVTPYYFKPNQSGSVTDDSKIILGTQSYSFELVKPYYRMEKPIIEYPKNNTTWHNKDFRILTTIPEDPDFNEYTQQQRDNYTYGNIQVEITPTGGTKKIYDYTNMYSGYATQYPNCFSSLLTDYAIKKAIWLNRTDGDVATASKYTIRVRVQKANYQYTNAEMQDNSDTSVTWSPWSDAVVLNITAVTKQNLVKGNKIMATEQNTVANYSTRLLACYPFTAKDSRNVLKSRGDIIYRAEYQGIYETVKSIITGVKNYCTYTNSGGTDRRDVQFGYGTKALPAFTAIQEIILANETGVDDHGTTGRNYKNILTGYMIDCLK